MNAEIGSLEVSRLGNAVIFPDGSFLRGTETGWGYSARVIGQNVKEDSGAFQPRVSSIDIGGKAISQALRWLSTIMYRRAVLVTDSMITWTKIQKGFLYSYWIKTIKESHIEKILWVFCLEQLFSVKGERELINSLGKLWHRTL